MGGKSQIISVSMDATLLARLDAWVAERGFAGRSSALQHLVRERLDTVQLADEGAVALGTVTLVYDHHRRDLMERLAHLQHEHLAEVVALTHVHLRPRCLEVLILKGAARDVRSLGERIASTRGVERSAVTLTSAGEIPRSGARRRRGGRPVAGRAGRRK